MTASVPAGWYPDPSGAQTALRWWDGAVWTEHTAPVGEPATQKQPEQRGPTVQQGHVYGDQSFGGNMQVGEPVVSGYRSPMTEQVLFVSQKRKIIELTNEYAVFARDGGQIGWVAEVGQSKTKKAMRFLADLDQFFTHRMEIRDMDNRPLLALIRPAKFMKSTLVVQRPDGAEVGRLVQRNVFGKIRFALESDGQEIGSLNAQNWKAWNFSIKDGDGAEIARVTKTWEGLMTTLFTTADKYMVEIERPLADPIASLVVAAALTVDTALKQDARGFN